MFCKNGSYSEIRIRIKLRNLGSRMVDGGRWTVKMWDDYRYGGRQKEAKKDERDQKKKKRVLYQKEKRKSEYGIDIV